MADLATVFHWTPTDCAAFTLRELMDWRERARKRSGAADGAAHGARSQASSRPRRRQ
ncbi:GpE family phage tail protein [Halomonas organivorans]|uniref:GpE family phage tail protein n=1 Tax=Halomonas organivorans TaxID=257772 RepID=UPI0016095682|nr:GpE family phage tail protein [Halomonas organivorans]